MQKISLRAPKTTSPELDKFLSDVESLFSDTSHNTVFVKR